MIVGITIVVDKWAPPDALTPWPLEPDHFICTPEFWEKIKAAVEEENKRDRVRGNARVCWRF